MPCHCGYQHKLWINNTYWFYAATMNTPKHLNVTFACTLPIFCVLLTRILCSSIFSFNIYLFIYFNWPSGCWVSTYIILNLILLLLLLLLLLILLLLSLLLFLITPVNNLLFYALFFSSHRSQQLIVGPGAHFAARRLHFLFAPISYSWTYWTIISL